MKTLRLINSKTKSSYGKFSVFLIPFTFIVLADAVNAYVFPIVAEFTLGSNTLMGFVLASSSVFGFLIDMTFPKFFPNNSWKDMLMLGIVISILFPTFILLGFHHQILLFFFLASLIWGIYYELISFSSQDYVVSEEAKSKYLRDWGIIGAFWHFTALIGPILAVYLLSNSLHQYATVVIAIQLIALVYCLFSLNESKIVSDSKSKFRSHVKSSINLVKEFTVLEILGSRVFRLALVGFMTSLGHSFFWTLGGLWGEEVGGTTNPHWLIISIFSGGLLVGSILFSQIKIKHHLMDYSEFGLVVTGFLLTLLYFFSHNWLVYLVVFIATIFMGAVTTLNEAVFSSVAERDSEIEMYMHSILRMAISASYVMGPLISGVLADKYGYQNSFIVLGILMIVIGSLLYLTADDIIKLPISRIKKILAS